METKMEIDPQLVRQLREKTNAGIMDCKRALAECGGDLEEERFGGKLEKVYRTFFLMVQGRIKDGGETVTELVATNSAELGENDVIRRFTRYLVGEPLSAEIPAPVEPEEAA